MSEEIGKRIGDYEILSELGSGGMGRVYKVRNVLSDRIEAMKVLLPDVASRQDLAARFLREIKVLASLSHPNIAQLRTALTVDNQLLMIMEYVEGTTLAERLEKGAIPLADILNYIDQVLSALSYAHQQGVIHRDIKPSNMILTPQGVVKLMDFGIARSGNDRSLTMTGTTLGSLNYMSPEQVKGEPTDARSDIYSVGISLYELVTGKRPFQAHSDYSLMAAHVKETPRPPIELDQNVPSTLNEIILMAIAKDPAQRFKTADAFRNALKSVQVPAGVSQAAPAAAVSPDAVTATLWTPVPAPANAAVAEPAPSLPSVTPAPAPVPTPPPVQPRTHRGLYMALGACIVLVVLVLAGIYVPRRSKTQAKTPPEQPPASTGAQTANPAPQDVSQQAPAAPATPNAEGSAMPLQPTTPPETVPAAEHMAAAPATPSSSQSSAVVPPKSGGSAPAVNAAIKKTLTATRPQSAAVPASPAANPAAKLSELEDEVDQLSNRIASVDASLDHLQQQQNASGYGLRRDIVERQASMKTNLSKAQSALQQHDAERAKKYLNLAQGDAEALEHFLGH